MKVLIIGAAGHGKVTLQAAIEKVGNTVVSLDELMEATKYEEDKGIEITRREMLDPIYVPDLKVVPSWNKSRKRKNNFNHYS